MRVRESERQNVSTSRVAFQAQDSRGRIIGAYIKTFEVDFTPLPEGDVNSIYYTEVEPGHYYCFHPWATRNGVLYGAVQPERRYSTAEERDQAIEKYLADARKRALAKGHPIDAI